MLRSITHQVTQGGECHGRYASANEIINLRASRRQKELIDHAAELLDRSRSEFMLEAACREAEALLADQTQILLPGDKFKRFMAALDKPPAKNPRLQKLLRLKAPWDR